MESIYRQVSQRLSSQVGEIKFIDLDYGQIDVLDQNMLPAVIMPCALIDIDYPDCQDLGEGLQEVEARIMIKLAFRVPYPTDSLSDSQRREKALAVMRITRKVYKALQGWGTDDFATLSRIRQTSNNRYPGVKVVDLVFSTRFVEL